METEHLGTPFSPNQSDLLGNFLENYQSPLQESININHTVDAPEFLAGRVRLPFLSQRFGGRQGGPPCKDQGRDSPTPQGRPTLDQAGVSPEDARGPLAQGIPALCLLVDAWFTSPKFCQAVKDLGLQIIGRLKRG